MARIGVYRVNALAYYVVIEHSIIFTGIGDVDMRSSTVMVETQVMW